MGRMFETLQPKKFKMQFLKWNHLSCAFLKKLPKLDIAKLNLKISIRNRPK